MVPMAIPMAPVDVLYPAMITLFSVLLYLIFAVSVGKARGKYSIQAPAVTGDIRFERIYRVQQNTLEQLAVFLPSLWLCSAFFLPNVALVLGILWIIGRILYARGYYAEAGKRMPGFIISMLSVAILWIGAGYGILRQWML